MPRESDMDNLGGREEWLGSGRGIIPPSSNSLPDFTGERIGVIVYDEESGDLKIIVDPVKEDKTPPTE